MKIALDYDGTYTLDPEVWDEFCDMMIDNGHEVYIVTAREFEQDNIDDVLNTDYEIPIIYCDGVAKKWFCHHKGLDIDVWIDDKPQGIIDNGPLTRDQIAEWRRTRM